MNDLAAMFERDLEERPAVYWTLRRFALQAAAATTGRIGMKAVAERARWEAHIEQGNADFKINNSLVSRYGRLLAEREPSLAGRFEFRALATDRRMYDHIDLPTQDTLFDQEAA